MSKKVLYNEVSGNATQLKYIVNPSKVKNGVHWGRQ
jgi:hypothetical protein